MLEIRLGGRLERYTYRFLPPRTDGPDAGPRVVRLHRLDDGAECRVIELLDGLVCDCPDFTEADGCRHDAALLAVGLLVAPPRGAGGEP